MAIYERMMLRPKAGALPEYNRQTENYVPGQGGRGWTMPRRALRAQGESAKNAGYLGAASAALGGIGNLGSLWLRYGNKDDPAAQGSDKWLEVGKSLSKSWIRR